ncbi:MAG: hypothetical protein IJ527_10155 [Prevotella sp.]|nr:hypothetical protein [Prevotella sp.]
MRKRICMLLTLLSAVTMTALADVDNYYFQGYLGDKTAVTVIFDINAEGIAAGYIYYPKAKKPAPILIAGERSDEEATNDGTFWVYMREFQADGTVTGIIYMHIDEPREGEYTLKEGSWVNPKTEKELQMRRMEPNPGVYMPQWYPGCALTPADPGKIGVRYGYQQWNRNSQCMMGGGIDFKAAGKNKVHFDICNSPQNIAEGQSEAGRPAVLNGNTFDYLEVNECHYGFRAFFYDKFVVLRTIAGQDEMFGCFGMGTAFDGVYIKLKK